jgi:hypothetical protein
MTVAKSPQFRSFEAYLLADPADLPEGRCEYWDGELVPVMSESFDNGTIAVELLLALVAIGVPFELIKTHFCEILDIMMGLDYEGLTSFDHTRRLRLSTKFFISICFLDFGSFIVTAVFRYFSRTAFLSLHQLSWRYFRKPFGTLPT